MAPCAGGSVLLNRKCCKETTENSETIQQFLQLKLGIPFPVSFLQFCIFAKPEVLGLKKDVFIYFIERQKQTMPATTLFYLQN